MRCSTQALVAGCLLLAVVGSLATGTPSSASRSGSFADFPKGLQVDTRIGTGGLGFGVGSVPPGVQVPFGALRLSPDTAPAATSAATAADAFPYFAFNHFGGYWHDDGYIRGFSHTHMVGAGAGDLGTFMMSVVQCGTARAGSVVCSPHSSASSAASPHTPASSDASVGTFIPWDVATRFSHDAPAFPGQRHGEWAKPGDYRVWLPDESTLVELTACGSHAGAHRYSWTPESSSAFMRVLLDVCAALGGNTYADTKKRCLLGTVTAVRSDRQMQLTGYVQLKGSLSGRAAAGYLPMWFTAVVTANQTGVSLDTGVWQDGVWMPGGTQSKSSSGSAGAFVTVSIDGNAPPSTVTVDVQVGLSFLGADQATKNLRAQCSSGQQLLSFEAIRNRTQTLWERTLNVVSSAKFPADSPVQQGAVQLYSAVYRAHLSPTNYLEPGGSAGMQYPAIGSGRATAHPISSGMAAYLSDMSIWDIHRTLVPLMNWWRPRTVGLSLVDSLYRMGYDGGDIPRWPLASVYTGCMCGQHANIMIADAAVKNVGGTGVNYMPLLDMMNISGTNQRPHNSRACLSEWLTLGYVSQECQRTAASLTLAYSYDDWAVVQVAKKVGRGALAEPFARRSSQWRNVLYSGPFDAKKRSGSAVAGGVSMPSEGETGLSRAHRAGSFDPNAVFRETHDEIVAVLHGHDELRARTKVDRDRRSDPVLDEVWMCARRRNGSFDCPSAFEAALPYPLEHRYVEGDAWQWLWFVPHDVEGLASAFPDTPQGSPVQNFARKLDTFFNNSVWWKDTTLPNPFYWAGNEPDLLAPWLFNAVGRPYRTQEWVSWVLQYKYGADAGGVPGNDDYGTMSAWQLWANMGLYPITGSDRYVLGQPALDLLELNLDPRMPIFDASSSSAGLGSPAAQQLTISRRYPQDRHTRTAPSSDPPCPFSALPWYTQRVWVDGKQVDDCFITHAVLAAATSLVFDMGRKPVNFCAQQEK